MSEIVIAQTDQGATFEVRQGDSIVIRLDENPTTGYRWEIDLIDSQVVELQDTEYSVAPGAGIGGGGKRTFLFRAKSPGTTQIKLRFRREWEPEDAAIERFGVNIQVQ